MLSGHIRGGGGGGGGGGGNRKQSNTIALHLRVSNFLH